MKNSTILKRVALVVLVAVMAVAMVACGGTPAAEGGEASVVGSWTIDTMAAPESDAMSIEDFAAANGVTAESLEVIYEFAEDGVATTTMESLGINLEGTYEFDGTTLAMTFAEVTTEGTYSAESDTIEIFDGSTGYTTVLKRA